MSIIEKNTSIIKEIEQNNYKNFEALLKRIMLKKSSLIYSTLVSVVEFAFAANILGNLSFTSSALSPPVATPGDRVGKAVLAHSIELPIGWVTIGRTGLPSPPI